MTEDFSNSLVTARDVRQTQVSFAEFSICDFHMFTLCMNFIS